MTKPAQYKLEVTPGYLPALVRLSPFPRRTIVRGTIETICKYLWAMACKHEGIDYHSKFVVLSSDNPILPIYNEAMQVFLKRTFERKTDFLTL